MECRSLRKARMLMRWPQRTQTRGSTWYTLAISLAQLGQQRRRGGGSVLVAAGSAGRS